MLFLDIPGTVDRLLMRFPDADAVLADWQRAEEQMFYPVICICGIYAAGRCGCGAGKLCSVCEGDDGAVLRVGLPVVFARDRAAEGVTYSVNSAEINAAVVAAEPDLILGSTFEAAGCQSEADYAAGQMPCFRCCPVPCWC